MDENKILKTNERERALIEMAYKAGKDDVITERMKTQDIRIHKETARIQDRHALYKQDIIDTGDYRDCEVKHNNIIKVIEVLKVLIGIGIIICLVKGG